jgi:hypothetical protein
MNCDRQKLYDFVQLWQRFIRYKNLFVVRSPVFDVVFVSNIIYEYVVPWVGNLTAENSLRVQRDLRYGDFGSDNVLEMQPVNFVIIT